MNADRSVGSHLIRLRNGEDIGNCSHNPYLFAAHDLLEHLYTMPELEKSFPSIFEDSSLPIILEIGCYMGDTVVELASCNPGINVLGVDIKYKRVVKSCRKVNRAGIKNARIAICDARQLISFVPKKSLAGICAFFPDPWQKKRQQKHRFLNEFFFKEATDKLTNNGFIWLKTDDKSYYEDIKQDIVGRNLVELERVPLNLIGDKHRTFFEGLFTRKMQPIYELIFEKRSD